MKITCSKQQLTEAVSNVQRAVSTKSSIPALEGILLKANEQGVTLCGYDLELGMTTTIEAKVDEPGSLVLSARLFGDIVPRRSGVYFFRRKEYHRNYLWPQRIFDRRDTCGGISGDPFDYRGNND